MMENYFKYINKNSNHKQEECKLHRFFSILVLSCHHEKKEKYETINNDES